MQAYPSRIVISRSGCVVCVSVGSFTATVPVYQNGFLIALHEKNYILSMHDRNRKIPS
jgi:hypothetical protein